MGLGLLLLAIGGLGVLAAACSSKTSLRVSGEGPEAPRPCCSSCGEGGPCGSSAGDKTASFFDGQLIQGKPYRLRLSVDLRYQDVLKGLLGARDKTRSPEANLAEAMKDVALRMGFGPTMLVTHDPTDPSVWHLLTRWSLHSNRTFALPSVTPLSVTLIDEPFLGRQDEEHAGRTKRTAGPDVGLDRGLSDDEVWAITYALATDEDTKHLGGLASTMGSDYPIARDLLKAKSVLAALRAYRSTAPASPASPAIPGNPTKSDVRDLNPLIDILQRATAGLGSGVVKAWDRYRTLVVLPKDEKALGNILKALTASFVTRKTRPAPIAPSPAALQLAYATRRPQLSLVEDNAQISSRLTAIGTAAKAGDPDGQKAQAKISDANRTLERLQWVGWYKRIHGLDTSGPAPGSLTGSLRSAWSTRHDLKRKEP
jgi:hypothetical protein